MPWGQTVVRRREQASLSATRPLLPCDLAAFARSDTNGRTLLRSSESTTASSKNRMRTGDVPVSAE